MIIVSQSKNNIVNFENINLIGLDGEFKIKARLGIHDEVLLGKYKTEERAKEVLKEITRYFRMFRGLTYMNDSIKRGIAKEIERDGQDAYVYTMPED